MGSGRYPRAETGGRPRRKVRQIMDQLQPQLNKLLRRRLSRVGWGVLLYLLTTQIIGGLLLAIPAVVRSIYLTMAVNEAVSYGLAPLILWLMIRPLPKGRGPELPLSPRAFARTAVFSLGTLYLFNLVTVLLVAAVEAFSGSSTGNLLDNVVNSLPTWLYLVMVGAIAPVMEELIFRKLLLDRLRPFGDRCAILVSAVAFGLFHMNLYQLFYATALGLVFAGVVVKTGRIWHTIALHAIVNLGSAGMSALTGAGRWGAGAAGILMFLLMGLAIYFFSRYARTFRFAPPAPPVTDRQALSSLLRAPGIWVCTVLTLAASVAVIFLV